MCCTQHEISGVWLQINLEQAENLIKRHEAFLTTMEANDDKINSVVQFAGRLCDEGHFAGMTCAFNGCVMQEQ